MHGRNWIRAAALAAVLVGSAPVAGGSAKPDAAAGKVIYDRDCASCHGATGKGDGDDAAYFTTKPTDRPTAPRCPSAATSSSRR